MHARCLLLPRKYSVITELIILTQGVSGRRKREEFSVEVERLSLYSRKFGFHSQMLQGSMRFLGPALLL